MRRHCEQDSSTGAVIHVCLDSHHANCLIAPGNVVCFVPNGPKAVKLVERWAECRKRSESQKKPNGHFTQVAWPQDVRESSAR